MRFICRSMIQMTTTQLWDLSFPAAVRAKIKSLNNKALERL